MKNNTKALALTFIATTIIATGVSFASNTTWTWTGNGVWYKWQHILWITTEEKTQLQNMSDTEKTTFFESKKAANELKRTQDEAKRVLREAIIDKLLAGETLTESDKKIVEEMKLQRIQEKAKRLQREQMKILKDKERNGEILTPQEQIQLDTLELNMPPKGEKWLWKKRWWHGLWCER